MEDAWKLEKEGSCWGEKTEERVVAQIGNLFNATPTLLLLLPCLFSLFLSLHSLIHSLPYTHSLSLSVLSLYVYSSPDPFPCSKTNPV